MDICWIHVIVNLPNITITMVVILKTKWTKITMQIEAIKRMIITSITILM